MEQLDLFPETLKVDASPPPSSEDLMREILELRKEFLDKARVGTRGCGARVCHCSGRCRMADWQPPYYDYSHPYRLTIGDLPRWQVT